MAAKNRLQPYNVVPPVTGNMLSTLQSNPTNISGMDDVGYSGSFTGAPVGTFSVQASVDYQPGLAPTDYPINAGTWTTLPLNGTVTASGSPDNFFIDVTLISAPWIRLVYTPTSGTGTLSVWVCGKGL
jgi:hypothetical protein